MACRMIDVNPKQFEIILINKGMTISKIARLSGISTETIYRMLDQKRASIKTLGKLAKALDIEIERVLEDVS